MKIVNGIIWKLYKHVPIDKTFQIKLCLVTFDIVFQTNSTILVCCSHMILYISASLLKGLKHANIVTLHDIIHTKETLTFVFEYVVSIFFIYFIFVHFLGNIQYHIAQFFFILFLQQLLVSFYKSCTDVWICVGGTQSNDRKPAV